MQKATLEIRGAWGLCSVDIRVGIGPALATHLGSLLGDGHTKCVLITDHTVARLHGEAIRASWAGLAEVPSVHSLPSGEGSKSLAELSAVYEFLAMNRLPRNGLMIALGGGVVSDLCGFAAATWMRGVSWVVVPTTLEAQIDASLGGKTAINVPGGKNLVGAFHMPRAVLIDPSYLHTLDPRDVRAGLAESIKHALISSGDFVDWHEQHAEAILALDSTVLAELIERNVRVKGGIVERDPFERTGERMTLNFGHTIGHAIEECSGYALRHGECVALGLLAACRLSHGIGLLDRDVVERVQTLLTRLDLPTSFRNIGTRSGAGFIPFERIMETMTRDKKVRSRQVQWVLLESIGRTCITSDVNEHAVREAYELLLT